MIIAPYRLVDPVVRVRTAPAIDRANRADRSAKSQNGAVDSDANSRKTIAHPHRPDAAGVIRVVPAVQTPRTRLEIVVGVK